MSVQFPTEQDIVVYNADKDNSPNPGRFVITQEHVDNGNYIIVFGDNFAGNIEVALPELNIPGGKVRSCVVRRNGSKDIQFVGSNEDPGANLAAIISAGGRTFLAEDDAEVKVTYSNGGDRVILSGNLQAEDAVKGV